MSSGLTSRPSLSVERGGGFQLRFLRVSSGLTSRPSLSVEREGGFQLRFLVSSGLTSRPSLSALLGILAERRRPRVVGVNLPTFVERWSQPWQWSPASCVVGVNLPTFVERSQRGSSRLPTTRCRRG